MSYDFKINSFGNDKLNNSLCEVECICGVKSYISKTQIIQCFLCHKYQHITCIYQAKYVKPYICFNCQFRNNHFYLRWKKTILPAQEVIYSKKWAKKQNLLNKGTKTFKFSLNLNELYKLNSDKNSSHYLAFIWMTNNGKPFNFGFPDNINIKINGKDFYSTETKGFKYPLLLSLDNTYNYDYSPKKKRLITMESYEIPHASEFFAAAKSSRLHTQNVTISFEHPLENYYGSEFQYEDIRRFLFYIGVFQEIKIPQLSMVKSTNKLSDLNSIFGYLYNEKVLKMDNILNMNENDEINNNMNFKSYISNQKIINPIRGIFCQHSEILDFGECCRYITSKSQIYKCCKCNKPLNIMCIDSNSKKIFDEYKNQNFDEIYFDNNFKFIKGIKEKNDDKTNNTNTINLSDLSDNSDFVSDSFYEYHKNELEELNKKEENTICEIIDSSEENNDNNNDKNNYNNNDENGNENVIELEESISLNSNSSNDNDEKDKNNYNNNKNINNLQLNNKTYKTPKIINYSDKNKMIDLKIEMKFNSIKERLKKELLQRKRNFQLTDINEDSPQKKLNEEVIDISSQQSINESSNFIPIDNEYAPQFSTNSN